MTGKLLVKGVVVVAVVAGVPFVVEFEIGKLDESLVLVGILFARVFSMFKLFWKFPTIEFGNSFDKLETPPLLPLSPLFTNVMLLLVLGTVASLVDNCDDIVEYFSSKDSI